MFDDIASGLGSQEKANNVLGIGYAVAPQQTILLAN
jgi:hypothetical protein